MRTAVTVLFLLSILKHGTSVVDAADYANPPASSFSDDQELIQAVDRLRCDAHGTPDDGFAVRLHDIAWSHLDSQPLNAEEELFAIRTLCERSRPTALRSKAIERLSILPSNEEYRRAHDAMAYVFLACDWLNQGKRLSGSDPDRAKQYVIAGLVLASEYNLKSGLSICHRAVSAQGEVASELFSDRLKALNDLREITQRQSTAVREEMSIFWPIAEALDRIAKEDVDVSPDDDIKIVLDKLDLLKAVVETSVSRAWQVADIYRDVRRQAAGRASPAVIKRIENQLSNQLAAAQSPDFRRWLSEALDDRSERRTHAQIGGTEDGQEGRERLSCNHVARFRASRIFNIVIGAIFIFVGVSKLTGMTNAPSSRRAHSIVGELAQLHPALISLLAGAEAVVGLCVLGLLKRSIF